MSSASARRAGARQLVWSDEFAGQAGSAPAAGRWTAVTGGGGWGNGELEYYTARASNVALDGHGHLAITARAGPYTGPDGLTRAYSSARLQTKGRFATAYGELQARIKLPSGRGLWPAFWALGDDIDAAGWPGCGEIDVMENLGSDPFTAYGSIHGPAPGGAYGVTGPVRSHTSLASAFHVYAVTWSPGEIDFSLDGTVYARDQRAALAPGAQWVFNRPFYLLLNLAVGGSWPGAPSAATRFPATMLVDWVRVYT